MKSFEDMQVFGKEGFEAMVASSTAMTKGFQAIAQEVADYSRKSVEMGQGAFEKATAAPMSPSSPRPTSSARCTLPPPRKPTSLTSRLSPPSASRPLPSNHITSVIE